VENPLLDASPAHVFWTTTNIVEGFPGVVTPLTWTLWGPAMDVGSRRAYQHLGILSAAEAAPDVSVADRFSGVFFGRAALNVDVVRKVADRAPGTSGAAAEAQLLGSVRPEVPTHTALARLPLVASRVPIVFLTAPRRVRRFVGEQREWWRGQTTGVDRRPAAARMAEVRHRLELAMAHHSITSMIAVALLDQTASISARAGRADLETLLNTGQGEVEEARFVADVWRLSRDEASLDEILADHGFQGSGELSLPSYRSDPSRLIGIACRYAELGDGEDPAASARRQRDERARAEREVLAALGPASRPLARRLFALARRGIPLREATKAAYVMGLDAGRAVAADRFAELEANGFLIEPDDVFFLTYDEVTGPDRDLRGVVADRRAVHDEYQTLELPRSWYGQPEPVAASGPDASDAPLQGIPVYAGVVEARARVATSVAEASAIGVGEILVCSTTDPSWASVMPLAGGLVIDIGSQASHGAIVARELGLPCVINTATGTRDIATGDLVLMDGTTGIVEVLERAT